MRHLYRLVVATLVRRRTLTLEWYLALQTMVVGAWVLTVLSFALSFRGRFFGWFTLIGFALVAQGALSVYALAKGRVGYPRTRQNLNLCRRSMFGVAMLWSLLTVLSGLSRPLGLYWPILLGFVGAALWCYMRLALRFKED